MYLDLHVDLITENYPIFYHSSMQKQKKIRYVNLGSVDTAWKNSVHLSWYNRSLLITRWQKNVLRYEAFQAQEIGNETLITWKQNTKNIKISKHQTKKNLESLSNVTIIRWRVIYLSGLFIYIFNILIFSPFLYWKIFTHDFLRTLRTQSCSKFL